jgi:hypothetical protein
MRWSQVGGDPRVGLELGEIAVEGNFTPVHEDEALANLAQAVAEVAAVLAQREDLLYVDGGITASQ